MTSFDMVHRFADGDSSPELISFLRDSIREAIQGADVTQRLGLDRSSRIRARDAALMEAANILKSGRDPGAWELAGQLASAIRRFQARALPMIKAGKSGELSELDQALRRAFDTGIRVIASRRKLYDFLTLHC